MSLIIIEPHVAPLAILESAPRQLPGDPDAIVGSVSRAGNQFTLIAFVVLGERPAATDEGMSTQVRQQLAERVPPTLVPSKLYFLESGSMV